MFFSKTRVGIEKQSKVSEVTGPTLHPRLKIRPHELKTNVKKTLNPRVNVLYRFQDKKDYVNILPTPLPRFNEQKIKIRKRRKTFKKLKIISKT